MKLIDIIDNKVVISSETLCISPFSEIWNNDKSKDKTLATNQIKYIWFYSDFTSPYYSYSNEEKSKLILSDVIKDKSFKIDKIIKEGIDKYTELNITPGMKLLESAYSAIFKMKDYFSNIDFTEDDIEKVTKAIVQMPKLIDAIEDAKKKCYKESSAGVKVRGDKKVGLFEDQ